MISIPFKSFRLLLLILFFVPLYADPKNVLPEEGGGGWYAYFTTSSDDFPEIRDKVKNVKAPILVLQGQYEFQSYGDGYE